MLASTVLCPIACQYPRSPIYIAVRVEVGNKKAEEQPVIQPHRTT